MKSFIKESVTESKHLLISYRMVKRDEVIDQGELQKKEKMTQEEQIL